MAANYSSYASGHASGQLFYATLNPSTPLLDEVRPGYAPLDTPNPQLNEETEARQRYSPISPSTMSGDTEREEDTGPGPSHPDPNPAQPGMLYQPTPLPQRTSSQPPRKRKYPSSTGGEGGEASSKRSLSADGTDRVVQAISAMELIEIYAAG